MLSGVGLPIFLLSLQWPEGHVGLLRLREALPSGWSWHALRERIENVFLDHLTGIALGCFVLAISTIWGSAPLADSEASHATPSLAVAAVEPKTQEALRLLSERAEEASPLPEPAASRLTLSPQQERRALVNATSVSLSEAYDEREQREVVKDPAPAPSAPAKSSAWELSGKWGPTRAACGSNTAKTGWLPISITEREARAGETVCALREKRRLAGGWAVTASCASAEARWTSKVRLAVEGGKLRWTSERGSTVYVRCDRVNVAAR